LRERAQQESELRSHGRLLEQILEGGVPASAAGLKQLRPPLCLVVGQVRSADGSTIASHPDDAGFQELQALVHQFEPKAVITLHQQYIATVASPSDARPLDALRKSGQGLANLLREV